MMAAQCFARSAHSHGIPSYEIPSPRLWDILLWDILLWDTISITSGLKWAMTCTVLTLSTLPPSRK